jgi:hypothetical protein
VVEVDQRIRHLLGIIKMRERIQKTERPGQDNNFWDSTNVRSHGFLFYDGKENLNKGVALNTGLSPREYSEDIPTAVYNPGSVASIFYSGFGR